MSDLISRQAAIDEVVNWLKDRMTDGKNGKPLTDRIKDLPPAELERKKGKWIFYEAENERYDDMKCPFCKKTYTVDAYRIDDIGFTAEDFNFCPNCGAYMRGEKDD